MVDVSNIATIAALQEELRTTMEAADILTSGGRVPTMRVASAMDAEPAREVTVDVSYIAYPQQMIDAIVTAMQAHVDKLKNELTQMGVTGLQSAEPVASKKRKR